MPIACTQCDLVPEMCRCPGPPARRHRPPRVLNMRHVGTELRGAVVRVDRRTRWGNGWSHLPHSAATHLVASRNEAVSRHYEWLTAPEQRRVRNEARSNMKDHDAACWCEPLDCHGWNWIEVANDGGDW